MNSLHKKNWCLSLTPEANLWLELVEKTFYFDEGGDHNNSSCDLGVEKIALCNSGSGEILL